MFVRKCQDKRPQKRSEILFALNSIPGLGFAADLLPILDLVQTRGAAKGYAVPSGYAASWKMTREDTWRDNG